MLEKNKTLLSKYKYISFLFFIFLASFSESVFSQTATATGSPYSIYGIGDLQSPGFAQSAAMGGLTVGLRNDTLNPFFINIANPASYTSNKITTFEVGLRSNTTDFLSSSQSQLSNHTSLGYIAFAMPVAKWWGASFGLVPYSSVGYQLNNTPTIDSVGPVSEQYNGSGGINRFYIGNSFMPIKHLSIGVNASYMFGSIINDRTTQINTDTSQTNYFSSEILNTTTVSSLYFDFGLQYEWIISSVRERNKISKNDSLHKKEPRYHKRILQDRVSVVFGFTFGPSTSLRANDNILATQYINSTGTILVADTAENATTKTSVQIPLSIGYGISVRKGERWLIGADYAYQNWSTFNSLDEAGVLRNNSRASLGAQYVPNALTDLPNTYWKHVNYRIGFKYSKSYLDIDNTPLNEYSFSAGLGLPIGPHRTNNSFSMINVGFEIGQLGTTNNNLLQENYYKLTIGFTFNDKWFIKPKFN